MTSTVCARAPLLITPSETAAKFIRSLPLLPIKFLLNHFIVQWYVSLL
jgi:hypothetical protein